MGNSDFHFRVLLQPEKGRFKTAQGDYFGFSFHPSVPALRGANSKPTDLVALVPATANESFDGFPACPNSMTFLSQFPAPSHNSL
jgi:hypothetical protein